MIHGRMADEICVVTGGAMGLGLAIAEAFICEGGKVIIADRAAAVGQAAAETIGASFCELDVTEEAAWKDMLGDLENRVGALTVLVNNAGIGAPSEHETPENTHLEHWRRVFQVNAEGTFLGCKAAIPVMQRGGRGSIINVSSIAALVPTPFITAYGASKAAVYQFSRSVALYCAGLDAHIRCNTIHPGQIRTPMHGELVRNVACFSGIPESEAEAAFLSRIPTGAFGTPQDIASAAVYLGSRESSHVTGQRIVVDGGMELIN